MSGKPEPIMVWDETRPRVVRGKIVLGDEVELTEYVANAMEMHPGSDIEVVVRIRQKKAGEA